jgi:hypothetical protein
MRWGGLSWQHRRTRCSHLSGGAWLQERLGTQSGRQRGSFSHSTLQLFILPGTGPRIGSDADGTVTHDGEFRRDYEISVDSHEGRL